MPKAEMENEQDIQLRHVTEIINCSRTKFVAIIVNVLVFFNSRTAISGAIIGLFLVFTIQRV